MTATASSSPRFERSLPTADDRWQMALKNAVRDARELGRLLALPGTWVEQAERATQGFPIFAPRGYVARMRAADPADPLLRQVLPVDAELNDTPGFTTDPVGDHQAQRHAGLLHKYASRVLIVTTGACAVHCRYCFRRHFPYSEGPRSLAAWEGALAEIASDPAIDEVILSGGDPLTRTDDWLAALLDRLASIPQLRRVRIHTRLPIVLPERVTDTLLGWLRGTRLTPIMVVHANHAQELDATVANALGRLVDAGIPVLNQAVLLRGVNDSAASLVELCRALVDVRVMPYYLHQLDRVAGAAHFEVPVEQGLAIMAELRRQLPGYAVPRYVREVAGEAHKLEITRAG